MLTHNFHTMLCQRQKKNEIEFISLIYCWKCRIP